MLKKLTIAIISVLLLAFNANAGSDGDLVLSKNQPDKIKDCLNFAIKVSGISTKKKGAADAMPFIQDIK